MIFSVPMILLLHVLNGSPCNKIQYKLYYFKYIIDIRNF